MPSPDKPLLRVLKGEVLEKPPVWLMRQAGRYLPEYRALRAEKGGFLDLATDPDCAAEVTLQPIRRFGIDGIAGVPVDYLSRQIEAGVEAVQLFDSWSGSLSPAQFERWVIAPTAGIVSALKARHPETPIIGFPKGAGGKLPAYARETGVDALGLDETVDPVWAHANLPGAMPVQGNLDPLALIAGGGALESAV